MDALPPDLSRLRDELDRLAAERDWGAIGERVARLDASTLSAVPKVAVLAAEAALYLGRVERALSLALIAEAEFRARYDQLNLLPAMNLAGAAQFELGDLDGAEERFAVILELARERGEDELAGRATNNLGAIASLRGDHERALSLFRLSIPTYQKVGFGVGLAQTYHNLGIVNRDLGFWHVADRHYLEAQKRARRLGDRRLAAMARVGRAEIAHRRGDNRFAGIEAQQALKTFVEIGDDLGRADVLRLLGSIAAERDPEEAARSFEEALSLAREHDNLLLEAEVLEERAAMHAARERLALSCADLELAAGVYRRLGAAKRLEEVEKRLGRLRV
ncbi:MAG: tetratricopeptide repeat protein [Gemmatimonadota bacterium]|nr:MAG: tetratricopeptide repeat protein [Gemmatimonadota bacterium]